MANTSGAIKPGVPITSAGNKPGTTNPSISIIQAVFWIGSTKNFMRQQNVLSHSVHFFTHLVKLTQI